MSDLKEWMQSFYTVFQTVCFSFLCGLGLSLGILTGSRLDTIIKELLK